MVLCKFGAFSFVNKLSQILLELEPHNLIDRLVVIKRKLERPIVSGHE